MPTQPSKLALQKITELAHVPAVAYAYVEPKEDSKHEFVSTSFTVGKKNAELSNSEVDDNTRFPASSLSKIVFTYLVLQLVKKGHISLKEPLHNILPNARFLENGKYADKALQLTAQHVLSHTTGLPNFGPNSSTALSFDIKAKLGQDYSYSGEAFLYLQKVIETKMSKDLGIEVDLEMLAKKYVFDPLGMERSTFSPQQEKDTNIVKVHTELGQATSIYVGEPPLNSAGSLLTTAKDFSKFMRAWLKHSDDSIFQKAFRPTNIDEFPTCGLGWHLFKNKDNELIAYQFGENPNTQSFIAINVTTKKAAVFFTNSEHGMSIATQILSSPNLAPIGNTQELFKRMPRYTQSDEPGWKETMAGKIAEDQNEVAKARRYFEEAHRLAPHDISKQRRLEWFNLINQPSSENKVFTLGLKAFEAEYTNSYNDKVELVIKSGDLIYIEDDKEIKLVRISETDFLPEKDQSFKINIQEGNMSKLYVHGSIKSLVRQPTSKSQLEYKDAVSELRNKSFNETENDTKPKLP